MPDLGAPRPAETSGPVRPQPGEDPVDIDGLGPAPLPPPDQSLPAHEDDPWHPPDRGADPAPEAQDEPDVSIDDIDYGGPIDRSAIGDDIDHGSPVDEGAVGDDFDFESPIGDDGTPGIEWGLAEATHDGAPFVLTEANDLGFTLVDDDPD